MIKIEAKPLKNNVDEIEDDGNSSGFETQEEVTVSESDS